MILKNILECGKKMALFYLLILAEYLNTKHVATLTSGTAAIHLALIILGVKAGDEVISPSFTFSATVNPIAYQGAVPVLIDSEDESWNMSEDYKTQIGGVNHRE